LQTCTPPVGMPSIVGSTANRTRPGPNRMDERCTGGRTHAAGGKHCGNLLGDRNREVDGGHFPAPRRSALGHSHQRSRPTSYSQKQKTGASGRFHKITGYRGVYLLDLIIMALSDSRVKLLIRIVALVLALVMIGIIRHYR